MTQEMLVNLDGEILEHDNFEAVGRNMREFVTTWPWVEAALQRVAKTGKAEAIICGVDGSGWNEKVGELRISRVRGKQRQLRIVSTERPQLADPLVLKVLHEGRPVRETSLPDPRKPLAELFNADMQGTDFRMILSQSREQPS